MKDEYTFGKCRICHKDEALKNGVCKDCEDTNMPEWMKEFFGGFGYKKNGNLSE